MTGPVDVLAWFDDYIRRCGIYDDGTPIRAAVAELIEAATRLQRKAVQRSRITSSVFSSDVEDVRAALANVGPQS